MVETQLPDKSSTETVQLSPEVSFQWLQGGKAYLITITKASQEGVDAYIDANIAALDMWERGTTFFSVQDVSHPDVTITPYFRKRLDDILVHMKASGLQGHSVIVLANTIIGKIVRVYGSAFARRADPIEQHWVNGMDAGHSELEKLLKKYG